MWRVREWLLLLSPRAWWYSWKHAAHVVRITEAEAGGGFYGSMVLAEEEAWVREWDEAGLWEPAAFLPAPEVAHDWRKQTFTDLAPEALDGFPAVGEPLSLGAGIAGEALQVAPAILSRDDSGPGMVVPSGPGPDPGQAIQLQAQSRPNLPTFDLGPNAARVLAAYRARFTERWGCRLPAEVAA